jgi:hypothetical protein
MSKKSIIATVAAFATIVEAPAYAAQQSYRMPHPAISGASASPYIPEYPHGNDWQLQGRLPLVGAYSAQ